MSWLETNFRLVAKRVRRVPATLRAELVAAVRESTIRVHQRVAREKLRGGGPGALERRSGTAGRALFSRLPNPGQAVIEGRVGFNLKIAPYMRVQEFGGTIRPVHAQNLTIPLDDAKTAAGVTRFSARDLIANPKAFGYVRTFFYHGILFGDQGKFGESTPLFALKREVTIPARRPLRGALADERTWINARLRVAVAEGTRKGMSGVVYG